MKHPIPESFQVAPHTRLCRYVSADVLRSYLRGRISLPSVRKLREWDPSEGFGLLDCPIWSAAPLSSSEFDSLKDYAFRRLVAAGCEDALTWELNWETHPAHQQDKILSLAHDILERSRFVWCWYGQTAESALMWKVFAEKGAKIVSSAQRIALCLQSQRFTSAWVVYGSILDGWYLDPKCPSAAPRFVEIGDDSPQIQFLLRRPFFVKKGPYRDEREARFVVVQANGEPRFEMACSSPEQWIEHIVLSPYLNDSEAGELGQQIAELAPAPGITVGRSTLGNRSNSPIGLRSAFTEYFENRGFLLGQEIDWPDFLRLP